MKAPKYFYLVEIADDDGDGTHWGQFTSATTAKAWAEYAGCVHRYVLAEPKPRARKAEKKR